MASRKKWKFRYLLFLRKFGQNRKLNAASAVGSNNAFDISGIKHEGLKDKWHIVVHKEQSLTLHSEKNVNAEEWWRKVCRSGHAAKFCVHDRKGIRGSADMCWHAQIYNGEVGKWRSGHWCKQGNIPERLSLWCCSGFCKSSNGASPYLSSGVPR